MTKNIDTTALATVIANAVVTALGSIDLGNLSTEAVEATPTKAAKGKARKAKAAPAVTGPTFKEAQAALVVLKAEGKAPAGMTTKQAIEAGLLPALGTTAPKGKKAKAGKAKAKPEGTPFNELRARLVVLKSQGLIPAGMSVRVAQAEGLVDDEVRFIGTTPEVKAPKAKKGKKAKAQAVVTQVEAEAPAKMKAHEAPRRANGTIPPKEQWAERERMAATGKFDRFEIDLAIEGETIARKA